MDVSERCNTGIMWDRAEMHVELSEQQALQCMICLCEKALQWCDLLFQGLFTQFNTNSSRITA